MTRPAQPLDATVEEPLVLAAAAAFGRDGYEAASLNRILDEAGWAKSSFYHYFRNKQDLHDHVVSRLVARLSRGVVLPELETLEPARFWPAIQALLDRLGDAARRSPETRHLGLMYHHDGSASPRGALADLRTAVANWITHAVRRGSALGLVRDDIPVDLAAALAVSVIGVLDEWAVDRSLHSPGGHRASDLSLTLIRDLIGGRRANADTAAPATAAPGPAAPGPAAPGSAAARVAGG